MLKRLLTVLMLLCTLPMAKAQVNTDHMIEVGKNANYFEDYVLAVKYFNQVIGAKPYLAKPYFYRSVAKFNLGDYTGAIDDATKAISLNPFVVGSYEMRAWANAQLKNYHEAIDDYKMAIKQMPYALGLWHNYALCYFDIGQYDEALAVTDTMRIKDSRYTFPLRLRSEIYRKTGDTLAALANLDTLLTIDKYDHEAYMVRAIINLGREKYEEVDKDLTQAIKLSPKCSYYINRGLARDKMNNLRGAMEDYNMAIDLDPNNTLVRMNRGMLRERVGDYNRAIEDYSFVIERVPDNIRARYLRALLLRQAGDWQGAIDDLTRVLEEFPEYDEGYKLRAEMYRNLGLNDKAQADEIAELNARVWVRSINVDGNGEQQLSPEEMEKRRRRKEADDLNNYDNKEAAKAPKLAYKQEYGSEYRGQIQFKDIHVELCPLYAMTYYKKLSEVDGVVHYHHEMDLLQRMLRLPLPLQITASEQPLDERQIAFHFKDIEKQTARFGKEEDEFRLYIVRGFDYYLVQDLSAAIDDFTRAIAMDGSLWIAYYCRAVARYKQIESARADGKTDMEEPKRMLMPGDFMADASLNDYQIILSDLNKVIDLAPDFAYSYYNRGNVLSQLKDYHAAIASYNEALAIEPNLAEAYYNRGLTYIFLGQKAQGIADLSKAGELGLYKAYNVIKRFSE